MAILKAFQILFPIGALLLIISIYLLFPSPAVSDNGGLTLTPGATTYYYLSFNVVKGGRISGQFSEISGHPVSVYVFNSAQYTVFQAQGSAASLYSSQDTASGSYSADITFPGNYYLVFLHGTGYGTSSQNLTYTYTIDGYNTVILASGLAVLVGGIFLIVAGSYSRKKFLARAPKPTVSDVVMFDRPSTPPPG